MEKTQRWESYSWHCVNCGSVVTGYKNKNGEIKIECRTCHTTMIRSIKSSKHDVINVYAPTGQVHI